MLEFLEYNLVAKPKACVIWLHGLGADGYDFVPIMEQLELPASLAVRFVFPHAPKLSVTINGGLAMPAWFDIAEIDFNTKEDSVGINNTMQQINELVDAEIASGIPARNIVLAGFSQGGAIALYTGLRYPERLAGIMALSCYLPLALQLPLEASSANKDIPIMMAHGNYDPIVLIEWAKNSCKFLRDKNYQVAWHTYDMEHAVCNQEVADIKQFLLNILA